MATAFNEGSGEAFRKMWFQFHARNVDQLSASAAGEVENGIFVVAALAQLYNEQPHSVLIPLFGDAKLDELTLQLSNATATEKQKAYQTLRKIYPTRNAVLEKLR